VRVCRIGGRIVLVDLVAPTGEVRERFDHVHRLIDPHMSGPSSKVRWPSFFPAGSTDWPTPTR
jgi:hypothetical protein